MTKIKVPRLRFSEFSGEWKEDKLGDKLYVKMGQSPHSENYTKDNKKNILVQGNADILNGKINPRIYTSEITKMSKKNEIIMSVRAPVGELAINQFENVVIGRGVASLSGNKFDYYSLINIKNKGLWKRFSSGSTFDAVNSSDIKLMTINFPQENEQQKIGDFFTKLDKLIELQTQKVNQLKKLKHGYLQKMFPQEGETVPRLRFSGFSGEWKEEKANDIFINESIKNHGYEEVLAATQDNGIVYRKDLDIDIKFDKTTLNKYKYVIPGNIIISLRSFQGGFEVSNKKGIISPAYTIMSFKDSENNINYWKQYLKTYKFIQSLKKVTFGIRDGRSISFKEFSTLKLKFTENKNEQQKIGDFFAKLDKLIEEQSVKLDQLKQQKKAYLQKMFI
ncbi:restriction endonuclease subunit S [Apilactobacillus sp. 1-1-2]|uniref:restriction endonuclease subunit S n=1 Tax=Apilactobacillus sp. 1-1-2 TaxID=3411035 RepID=UPI003B930647